jgi:hypothetical protein
MTSRINGIINHWKNTSIYKNFDPTRNTCRRGLIHNESIQTLMYFLINNMICIYEGNEVDRFEQDIILVDRYLRVIVSQLRIVNYLLHGKKKPVYLRRFFSQEYESALRDRKIINVRTATIYDLIVELTNAINYYYSYFTGNAYYINKRTLDYLDEKFDVDNIDDLTIFTIIYGMQYTWEICYALVQIYNAYDYLNNRPKLSSKKS